MKRGLIEIGSCTFLALGLAACGGAKPPAAPAQPEPAPKAAPEAKAQPESKKPSEPAPSEATTKSERTRKPAKDFLLGSGWDFVLSFADSDLKAQAEEQCQKKSKEEDAVRACVAKASADAANDRLKLAPDDRGGWWLIYMGKVNGKEILYTKLQFKLAKDEPDKLILTPVGQDQGRQAIKKLPSELVLEMPDEYAVVFQHPQRGKLVFSVKVSGDASGDKKP